MPTTTDLQPVIDALRAHLRGQVIDPHHPGYDDARSVWNGLIDRRPAVIARCADADDVAEAVGIAARYRPAVSIRGGGHQVAGSAICDDGLVIDLSKMNDVAIDEDLAVARAGGGATWGDVDRATQLFALATPGGEVSTTGIGGFTLGGGIGTISRAYGLACDNLRGFEIVTADGLIRRVGPDRHDDLLWAARGGGRGLGVVTSFDLGLHPLGPQVATATVFYAYEEAERILRAWRDLAPQASVQVTPQLVLWSVPPDPEIPEELHGRKSIVATAIYTGLAGEAEPALAPWRELGTPLFDASGVVAYVDLQASLDDLFPAGGRYFMKSHGLAELSDDAIAATLAWDARRPTPASLVAIRTLGGRIASVDPAASAYPHRDDRFNVSVDAVWSDPALDAEAIGWARGFWRALEPFANGGVYVNFSGLDEEPGATSERVYGASARRLAEVRRRYDPQGLFAGAARRA